MWDVSRLHEVVCDRAQRAMQAPPSLYGRYHLSHLTKYLSLYITFTTRFMPTWTVQRTLNLPAVLNGPISALPPLMFTLLILGAPGCTESWGASLTHCPFVIICKTWTSSTSVTFDPLDILTHFCTKLDASMRTVPFAQPPE